MEQPHQGQSHRTLCHGVFLPASCQLAPLGCSGFGATSCSLSLSPGGSPRNLPAIERAGKDVQQRLTLFRKVIDLWALLVWGKAGGVAATATVFSFLTLPLRVQASLGSCLPALVTRTPSDRAEATGPLRASGLGAATTCGVCELLLAAGWLTWFSEPRNRYPQCCGLSPYVLCPQKLGSGLGFAAELLFGKKCPFSRQRGAQNRHTALSLVWVREGIRSEEPCGSSLLCAERSALPHSAVASPRELRDICAQEFTVIHS